MVGYFRLFMHWRVSNPSLIPFSYTQLGPDDVQACPLDTTLIKKLTKQLSEEIQLTMFGMDIIVCPATQKHYVIDVNVFPGKYSVLS